MKLYVDLTQIYEDLLELCEDNEEMKEAIKQYFELLGDNCEFVLEGGF